ncbi:MAG: hypothetical protein HYR63_24890 [Proteobacteria bacterium]|nr:hypothetical protein [Pseudomonadota bacterium]
MRNRRRLWLAAEATLIAIGRLERALDRSPLYAVWQLRSELDGALLLLSADGTLVDRDRLYLLMAGLSVERIKDFGAEALALRVLESVRALSRKAAITPGEEPVEDSDNKTATHWDREVKDALQEMSEARSGEGDLVSALRSLRNQILNGATASAAVAALPLHLARKGLVRRYLPALVFRPASVHGGSEQAWILNALERLAGGAGRGERELDRLTHTWRDWHRRLGPRRSTSSLPRLVNAMLAWPVVTPVQAARSLGLSVRGAAKLLSELVHLGILVQATRRQSWRSYLTADLAGAAALSLETTTLPPPLSAGSVREEAKRAAVVPDMTTSLYEERALPVIRSAPETTDESAIEHDRGQIQDVDLGRIIAEIDLVTRRVRGAIAGADAQEHEQDGRTCLGGADAKHQLG